MHWEKLICLQQKRIDLARRPGRKSECHDRYLENDKYTICHLVLLILSYLGITYAFTSDKENHDIEAYARYFNFTDFDINVVFY